MNSGPSTWINNSPSTSPNLLKRHRWYLSILTTSLLLPRRGKLNSRKRPSSNLNTNSVASPCKTRYHLRSTRPTSLNRWHPNQCSSNKRPSSRWDSPSLMFNNNNSKPSLSFNSLLKGTNKRTASLRLNSSKSTHLSLSTSNNSLHPGNSSTILTNSLTSSSLKLCRHLSRWHKITRPRRQKSTFKLKRFRTILTVTLVCLAWQWLIRGERCRG